MRLLTCTCCAMVLGCNLLSAQAVSTLAGESGFTIGTSYKKINDQFILPVPVNGNVITAAYNFSKSSLAHQTIITAAWSMGNFPDNIADVKTRSLDLYASKSFALWKSRDGKLVAYTGVSIRFDPSFTRAVYKSETRDSWTAFNDLSLHQSFVYSNGRSRLSWHIDLPVIGFASRPPVKSSYYNTINGLLYDSYSNIFFTFWQNHTAVASSLDWRRALNEHVHIILGAGFRYNSLSCSNGYKETQAGIYGGIALGMR